MSQRRDGRASRAIGAVATMVLGISAGAMLAEGAVLVPYWRSLPADDVLRWFAANEPRLVAFYGPLETAAVGCTMAAALLYAVRGRRGAGWLAIALLLAVGVLALYPLYFRAVNARFVAGTIERTEVAAELARWSSWQWLRVSVGVGAFAAAVRALLEGRPAD